MDDRRSAMFNVLLDTTYQGEEFSVLMGDQLRTDTDNGKMISSHPAAGLKYGSQNNSSYYLSSYGGESFKKLDRNFVYKEGHAKIIQNISATGPILNDSRFKRIRTSTRSNSSRFKLGAF
jgi:hypothetical protein